MILEVLAWASRQGKGIKNIQTGNKDTKLALFDLILHVENPESLSLSLSLSTRYKINIQKLAVFLNLTMNNPKKKLRKQFQLQQHQKENFFRNTLTKEAKDFTLKTVKHYWKINKDINK